MIATWKSLSTGAKVRRAHTWFWWAVVFPIVVIVLGYTAATTTLRARALLDDHSIAEAVVSADHNAKPSKSLARFKYEFDADGTAYSGTFSTLNSRADQIEIGGTIPIAFSNTHPGHSMRPELMHDHADVKAQFLSFLQISALGFVLIGVFYLFLQFVLRRVVRHLE